MVDGKKMSKSLGNFYTIEDVKNKNFDPISLRYLYLSTHYRKQMNFTWDSLTASQNALNKLRKIVENLKNSQRTVLSEEKNDKVDDFKNRFMMAMNDDLNTSKALAVLWEMFKSNIPSEDKYDLFLSFDEVLGLS
jgi:cysteinyl-tRNA synthetase